MKPPTIHYVRSTPSHRNIDMILTPSHLYCTRTSPRQRRRGEPVSTDDDTSDGAGQIKSNQVCEGFDNHDEFTRWLLDVPVPVYSALHALHSWLTIQITCHPKSDSSPWGWGASWMTLPSRMNTCDVNHTTGLSVTKCYELQMVKFTSSSQPSVRTLTVPTIWSGSYLVPSPPLPTYNHVTHGLNIFFSDKCRMKAGWHTKGPTTQCISCHMRACLHHCHSAPSRLKLATKMNSSQWNSRVLHTEGELQHYLLPVIKSTGILLWRDRITATTMNVCDFIILSTNWISTKKMANFDEFFPPYFSIWSQFLEILCTHALLCVQENIPVVFSWGLSFIFSKYSAALLDVPKQWLGSLMPSQFMVSSLSTLFREVKLTKIVQ